MAQAPAFLQKAAQFFNGGGGNQNTQQRQQNNQNNNQNQGNQNQGQQNNQQAKPGADSQGRVQGQGNENLGDGQDDNPLNAYAKLWETPEGDGSDAPPKFSLDSKILNQSAESLDFVRNMPEDMQEVMSNVFGDNKEAGAKLLNYIARQAYASALSHGTALTDKYMEVRGAHEKKGMGKIVKNELTMSNIDNIEAAKKNPIVREHLRVTASHLSRMYPDASPEWIQEKTQEFFTQMAGAISPESTQQARDTEERKAPGGEEFDWEGWLKADKSETRL